MKSPELVKAEPAWTDDGSIVNLPLGLLGFEATKKYVLLTRADEAPFLWLRHVDHHDPCFLVVPPAEAVPDYRPDISPEDVAFLGLEGPKDAMVLNVVTLHPDGTATVNLKGPIVVNRRTGIAKQVVPINATQLSLRHPLPVAQ